MCKEIDKLNDYILRALNEVYDRDLHLINNKPLNISGKDKENHVGERSIVFRFAHYFQNYLERDYSFENFNLDCEYNRNGESTKELPSFPRGTYPDVILHKRGKNTDNILVMEFKTYWNNNQETDIRKIKEFTDENGKYRFHYGVTILIERNIKDVQIRGYKNSKICYLYYGNGIFSDPNLLEIK